jgi:hypothetical protein
MLYEVININVGDEVIAKVAGREVAVTVEGVEGGNWRVKSVASGKAFKTKKLWTRNQEVAREPEAATEPTEANAEPEAATEPTNETGDSEPRPKKMSLLDAAIEVLKTEARAMNTREMVKLAIERELWVPTACKTPEQSLYGAIFREIKEGNPPRIRKSEKRGQFEHAL